MANYTFSNVTDFLNATNIVLNELQDDIIASAISSATVLYSIESGDNITIYFTKVKLKTYNLLINASTSSADNSICSPRPKKRGIVKSP